MTLSEQLQAHIEFLEWEEDHGLSPEKQAEAHNARKFLEVIVNDIIQSRESLTDGKLKAIEKLVQNAPELIENLLDDYFTRDVVNSVSGYVQRTMQLSRFEASREPSKVTNGYLKEAVRTYILGLPQASVALCRAALEQALKECLARQLSGEHIKFQDLLKEAKKWNILDSTTIQMARDVANAGDKVMHEKPTDLHKAAEVLTKVRGLLQHIYSVEGGF